MYYICYQYFQNEMSLHSLVKNTFFSRSHFLGFYSNHSLRATCATRLYRAGVDEQLIMETTGHRSLAVRRYKRTSEKQLKAVSSTIAGSAVQAADIPKSPTSPATMTSGQVTPIPFQFQGLSPVPSDDNAGNPVDVTITGKNFAMTFKLQ